MTIRLDVAAIVDGSYWPAGSVVECSDAKEAVRLIEAGQATATRSGTERATAPGGENATGG